MNCILVNVNELQTSKANILACLDSGTNATITSVGEDIKSYNYIKFVITFKFASLSNCCLTCTLRDINKTLLIHKLFGF